MKSSALTAAVNLAHHPNVAALARQLSGGNGPIQQWQDYALSCVQPGYRYYLGRLNDSMKIPLASFKAARLLSPHKVQELQLHCTTVDSFTSFPFVDLTMLAHLKGELPQYIAEADVSPEV